MNRRPFSVLPLAAVLVAAPFFGSYREEPLKFGLLQGLLVIFISISAAGGLKLWRVQLQSLGFATFWFVLLSLSIAAPFVITHL